jgi:hypothetical protein
VRRPRFPTVGEKVRTAVAVALVASIVGVWLWRTVRGESPNVVLFGVVLIYAISAGYTVFGKQVFDDAVDTANEVKGEDDGENGGSN